MNIKFVSKALIIITFFLTLKSNIYGISDNFKFVIDTVGMPRYNVYFEEINEESEIFIALTTGNKFHFKEDYKYKYMTDGLFGIIEVRKK